MKKWIVLVVVMLLAAWTIIGCGATPEAEEAAPAQEQAAPAQEETASEEQVQEEVEEQSETSAAAETASGDFAGLCGPYTDPVPLAEGAQASLDTINFDGEEITIAYLPMGTEFNFHLALNEGIEDITKASDSDGLDSFMLSPYSGSDQAGQMGMLQDVSSRPDVDAIVLISFDEQALAPLVEEAVNNGKAVIIINSDILEYPTPIHGVIGVNQRAANHALYDWAREQLGDDPRTVAVLEGEPGYLNDERSGGFKDGVEGTNWEIVSSVNGGWSVEKGNTTAMDVLQAHPDLEVLFAANDYMAQGAALAAQELGREDLFILGYDGDVNALEDIYRGLIDATTNASPVIMGRQAACFVLDILNGRTSGGYVNTPTTIVYQENVAEVLSKPEDLFPAPSDEILAELSASSEAASSETQAEPEAAESSGGFTPADAEFAGVCGPYTEPVPLAEGAQASLDTVNFDGEEITIAYLPMGTEFNFHIALNEGIEDITKASDSDGLDSFMLSPYSGSDQAGQMGMLQDVSSRPDIDAIVLISFDEQALAPLVEEAVNNGKAVIIINSDIRDYPTAIHGVIGVNQRAANHALYDWAREQLGDDPRVVAVLEGEPGYLNDERSGGFKDGVEGTNWEIVSSVNGGWSVEKGNTTAMDVLQAHPDLEVLFAANDYMAQGAALAAQELGREDLYILGYDGDVNALEDIYRGLIDATTNASPVIMGRQAACYALDILNGRTSGGYVNTPTTIVYQENVAEVLSKPEDLFPAPSDEILAELGVSVAQ